MYAQRTQHNVTLLSSSATAKPPLSPSPSPSLHRQITFPISDAMRARVSGQDRSIVLSTHHPEQALNKLVEACSPSIEQACTTTNPPLVLTSTLVVAR